ncbi:hypothetical protein GEV33_002514 [Tenebrio molitor]|uniref:Retrovirus-related Pol polyprotein from transposon TNT 1-94 n=1 Tax=Tenebrio molitor TaxID=7067 RepID=A0A8J6HTA8_TENMO|nr:hypothetical protein GEV33_002514 [Tenebrio molitor]
MKTNAVVVIHEDNTPPFKWPLGLIVDVHPGKDGIIRVVSVKMEIKNIVENAIASNLPTIRTSPMQQIVPTCSSILESSTQPNATSLQAPAAAPAPKYKVIVKPAQNCKGVKTSLDTKKILTTKTPRELGIQAERIVLCRDTSVLTESRCLSVLKLDDWKLCEDLCTVFKPLEEVTRQISGERYLTGSLVIVFNRTLTIYENKIPNDPALHQSAIAAAKKIKNELCARLQNIEYSGTFSICTFLDPRFKTHLFKDKSAADVAKKKVSELVASEINKENMKMTATVTTAVEQNPNPAKINAQSINTEEIKRIVEEAIETKMIAITAANPPAPTYSSVAATSAPPARTQQQKPAIAPKHKILIIPADNCRGVNTAKDMRRILMSNTPHEYGIRADKVVRLKDNAVLIESRCPSVLKLKFRGKNVQVREKKRGADPNRIWITSWVIELHPAARAHFLSTGRLYTEWRSHTIRDFLTYKSHMYGNVEQSRTSQTSMAFKCPGAEAVNKANYIRNRCPSKSLGSGTPYEVWTGKKPNVSHFREFGCRVFRLDRQLNRGKFDSRAKEEGTEKKAEICTEFVPDDLFKGETDKVESPRYMGIEMRSAEEVENPDEETQDEIVQEEPVEARTAEIEEEAFISEIPARRAMNSPEVDEWYDAMAVEIRSIIKNNTWKLVKRPDYREVIGSRIVLRNKYTANGTLERRKARLVAQGFSQRPGVHFKETFAPVARLSSIRLLASIAAQYDMNIRQFDVTCAYVNEELEEEIFMEPPKYLLQVLEMIQSEEDREVGDKARKMLKQLREGDHVCLLKKSLYGLRQAGRSWYAKLDGILRRFGAVPTKAGPCVYQIGTGEESTLIRCLVVYLRNSRPVTSARLMGYINKLLKSEEAPDENLPYRELVGALTYLSTATRPDISFAVNYLGQFNNCYGKPHWTAAKRVLRYLKGTTKLGLTFFKKSQFLEGPNDRKSFTGYVFMLGGGPVSWDARKQKTVALSSTEAEYMGLAEATKEATYLRSFLIELGLDHLSSVVVYEDNLGALKLAANPTFHNRNKHIDIKYHFIRDAVKEKILSLSHVSSAEMVADVLTKGLPGSRHQLFVTSWPAFARGSVSAHNLDLRAAPGVLSTRQCPVTPTETMTLRMCGRRSMTVVVVQKKSRKNAIDHFMDVRQIKDADIADELQNWSQQFDQDFQVINTPAEADAASARGKVGLLLCACAISGAMEELLTEALKGIKVGRTAPEQIDQPPFRPDVDDAQRWIEQVETIKDEFEWSDLQTVRKMINQKNLIQDQEPAVVTRQVVISHI